MAKQRIINTKFWSDNFVSDLNPLDRYLFLYFLTNEHTNICGIYELPLKAMASETGLEVDMLKKMLKRLSGKVYYIDGWIYIKNFQKHQSLNSVSVKQGIEKALSEIPSEVRLKIKEIQEIGDGGGTVGGSSYISESYLNLKSNSEVPSREIVDVIDAFKEVNPAYSKWFGNKTQRGAAQRLVEAHGRDMTLDVIALLPKTNLIRYLPTVTTPLQLEDKWAQLEIGLKKKKVEHQEKINNAIL